MDFALWMKCNATIFNKINTHPNDALNFIYLYY